MTKQIILEAETIEAIERALKLLENVQDVQVIEQDLEERQKRLEIIRKGADSLNLDEALDYLKEMRTDKPLPFRD